MNANGVLLFFLILATGSSKRKCSLFDKHCDEKYCNLHPNHVLCVFPLQNPNCEDFKEVIPDEWQESSIVDWHNQMRQRVAHGFVGREIRRPQPPAANMMKMEWDPELAKMAQRTANQCKFELDCTLCNRVLGRRFAVGQTVMEMAGFADQSNFDFLNNIRNYFDRELRTYNKNLIDKYVHNSAYSRYSQVVWWNTRAVGCGGASYRLGFGRDYIFLVVCNYGPGGNLPDAKVYEIGKQCSNCPARTACDRMYPGLCGITLKNFKVQDGFYTDKIYLGIKKDLAIVI